MNAYVERDGWTNGWMNGQWIIDGWMDTDGWVDGQMDEWDGQTSRWTNEEKNGRLGVWQTVKTTRSASWPPSRPTGVSLTSAVA